MIWRAFFSLSLTRTHFLPLSSLSLLARDAQRTELEKVSKELNK